MNTRAELPQVRITTRSPLMQSEEKTSIFNYRVALMFILLHLTIIQKKPNKCKYKEICFMILQFCVRSQDSESFTYLSNPLYTSKEAHASVAAYNICSRSNLEASQLDTCFLLETLQPKSCAASDIKPTFVKPTASKNQHYILIKLPNYSPKHKLLK